MAPTKWKLKNLLTGFETILTKCIFTIGRHPEADFKTESNVISRHHATITILNDGKLCVTDHQSTNGTYVNDKKITPKELVCLNSGDTILFGLTPTLIKNPDFNGPPFAFKVEQLEETCSGISEDIYMNKERDDANNTAENSNIIKKKDEKIDEIRFKRPQEIESSTSGQIKNHTNTNIIPDEPNLTKKEDSKCGEGSDRESGSFTTSNQENCIIISDSEDDDFSSSQIFKIAEKIKSEPYLNDEFDPYKDIKEELRELDYCDNILVDLTEDNERIESTNDLLNVLEASSPVVKTHVDESSKITNVSKLPNKLKQSLEIPKTTKPPIVEPHTEIPMVKNPQPSKRKTSSKKIIHSAKKRKTSECSNHKADNKLARKQKLKEIAGKDGPPTEKSVSSKNDDQPSCDDQSRSSHGEYPKTYKPPKLSFNIYKDSTETSTAPVTSRRKSTNEKSTTSAAKRRKSFTNEEKSTILVTKLKTSSTKEEKSKFVATGSNSSFNEDKSTLLVPSRRKSLNEIKSSPAPVTRRRKSSTNEGKSSKGIQKEDSLQDGTISSNASPDNNSITWLGPNYNATSKLAPDSTVDEDRSGLIWNLSSNQFKPSVPVNSKKTYDLQDEIYNILCWNVAWLMEQKVNKEVSAPVNFNKPHFPLTLTFKNFDEYQAMMMPLLKLELWQYIFQMTFDKDERKPEIVSIDHKRIMGNCLFFDCTYHRKESDNVSFRYEDYCLLEIKVKDTQNCYKYTCFGFITQVSQRQNERVSKFTIITKNFNKELQSMRLVVRVCANIGANLRLFKTIKILKDSPLCQYIINPRTLSHLMPIKRTDCRLKLKLNVLQKEVCSEASEIALRKSPGFYLVNGPPGTGKSSVIVNIVLEILYKCKNLKMEPRILLTAPSNAAVDGLIVKLYQTAKTELGDGRKILKIVRIGPDSSINEQASNFSLKCLTHRDLLVTSKLINVPEYKKVLDNQISQENFLKQHLGKSYSYYYKVAEDRILLGANIICTTLNSCLGYSLNSSVRKNHIRYTCCIIDEATQCNEVECLSPIQLGIDKFILVGDPKQLAAVVCNKEAQQCGFGKSLFWRMMENFSQRRVGSSNAFPFKMLCDQYRMKAEICEYPNKVFYGGKLKSFPKHSNPLLPPLKPYVVFNITKISDEDRTSYVNSDEANFIFHLLETLKNHILPSCELSIGIITLYKAQKEILTKMVANLKFNSKVTIIVNTIDSFQGTECDVIIISCVRYNSNYFLANERRLNVALTRAKQALYVVGNYVLFKQCRPLYDLREDAKRRKLLVDIKNDLTNWNFLHKYILV